MHLGVDPPDVCRPSPCARWECWTDPAGEPVQRTGTDALHPGTEEFAKIHPTTPATPAPATTNGERAREAIARNLQQQYEQWQPRVRYKTLLDPTAEELRKLCGSLRKSARQERILLHYNGHGVPRPTRNGELWVFNKQFTQYIPVNVGDVASWLGFPSIWVLDCSAAALLAHPLIHAAAQSSLVVFAASDRHETLPLAAAMPADILTSSLTTPLDMAIRWHCHVGGPLLPAVTPAIALCIPGRLNDRRTPLGELNWIFTAITDTIAWLVLPRDTFRRLYRQDLLVASLARNFLLAQRILKSLYCTAISHPPIPASHQHALWTLWDHVLDSFLAQLAPNAGGTGVSANAASTSSPPTPSTTFRQSTFFLDQLDAFDLWLRQHRNTPAPHIDGPPDQLPSALQVLLSQNLRPRALSLLAQFCDLGPWACLECLHVGIHPYILKLLQTGATQPLATPAVTRPLIHIWTRLLAVEPECRMDLLKDASYVHLINCLDGDCAETAAAALAAFIHENPAARHAVLQHDGARSFISLRAFSQPQSTTMLLWRLLLLAELWLGMSDSALIQLMGRELLERELMEHDIATHLSDRLLAPALRHVDPTIRAAATHALGALLVTSAGDCEQPSVADDEAVISAVHMLLPRLADPSPLVRLELLRALSVYITRLFHKFTLTAYDFWELFHHQRPHVRPPCAHPPHSVHFNPTTDAPVKSGMQYQLTIAVWQAVLALAVDPFEPVAVKAGRLVDEIHLSFLFPPASRKDASGKDALEKDALERNVASPAQKVLFVHTRRIYSSPSPSLDSDSPQSPVTASVEEESADAVVLESSLPLASHLLAHLLTTHVAKYGAIPSHDAPETSEARLRVKTQAHHVLETDAWLNRPTAARRFEPVALLDTEARITHLSLHPLLPHIYTAADDSSLTCWDWEEKRPVRRITLRETSHASLTEPAPVTSLAVLPFAQRHLLLSGTADGVVRLHSTLASETTDKIAQLPCTAFATGDSSIVALWSSGMRGIVVAGTRTLSLYDPASELFVVQHDRGGDATRGVVHCPEGSSLAYCVAPTGGAIECWDFRAPVGRVSVLATDVPAGPMRHLWSVADDILAAGTGDGRVLLWDLRHTKQPTRHIALDTHDSFSSLAHHPLLPNLFVSGSEHGVRVCELSEAGDATILQTLGTRLDTRLGTRLDTRLGPVRAVALHPERLLCAAVSPHSIHISVGG